MADRARIMTPTPITGCDGVDRQRGGDCGSGFVEQPRVDDQLLLQLRDAVLLSELRQQLRLEFVVVLGHVVFGRVVSGHVVERWVADGVIQRGVLCLEFHACPSRIRRMLVSRVMRPRRRAWSALR